MRVLIIADMEGVSGIERADECAPGHPAYERGRALLAAEVNAIGTAALEAGAASVGVIDWHAGGGNLRPELLDPRLRIVPEDLGRGYDGVLLTGFHALAGTRPGFLSHTMATGLALEIDGEPAGELSLLSRWAGEHGLPVGLVTGDRAATLEAERVVPETPTVTVKQARAWDAAAALPVERAHEALRAEVARMLSRPERWRPYGVGGPVRFRVRLLAGMDAAAKLPWLEADGDWLRGEVPTTKALIDLCDALAALMAGERRAAVLRAMGDDPAADAALCRAREAERAAWAAQQPWP